MLANPQNATRGKLNEVYASAENTEGKDLLVFENVADMIDADIGLKGGHLDPGKFKALEYSVILAKLALLAPEQLNFIFEEMGGKMPTSYGDTLYQTHAGHFTLLLDAIRSIDGNHQWQRKALPYPRQNSDPVWFEHAFAYGKGDGVDKGFRLFQDPAARNEVFLEIFSEPMIGEIGKLPQLRRPRYIYETCDRNPFPMPEDDAQNPITDPWRCYHPLNPYRWFLYLDHYGYKGEEQK